MLFLPRTQVEFLAEPSYTPSDLGECHVSCVTSTTATFAVHDVLDPHPVCCMRPTYCLVLPSHLNPSVQFASESGVSPINVAQTIGVFDPQV
jgi:hypothetical protein